MATIIIRNSTGSGAVPPSLQQGELAINTKDGKLFYGSGSGNIVKEFTGSGGGSAISASYALTASYASNGGVTQLLAGANISLSPTTGIGQVTISSTGGGSSFNTATGSYGSFYSTQTQTNVAGTARSMSLNTTDITNGVSVSGSIDPFNTYIKVENAGVYDIQFSAQVDKTDSGTDEIWIWIRKNGSNLTDTATSVQLQGNGAHYVAAWNFFVNAAAGDYFQLMWYSPDANVRLHAESAFGVVPGIPSLIVTANRVDQFLSNTGSFSGSFNGSHTGSFSGSFTGSLFGTASWATNALTASFVNTASTNAFVQNGNSFGATALLGTNDNQSLAFETSGSTRMFVSSSGNIGIGTNTPGTALEVNGVIRTPQMSIGGFDSGRNQFLTYTSGPVYRMFAGGAYGSLGVGSFSVGSSYGGISGSVNTVLIEGNTSIGTTTQSARLQVRGSGATSGTTALRVENTNASASFVVRDDGSVSIGTASPSVPLEVVGNMIISGGINQRGGSGVVFYDNTGNGGGKINGGYGYLNGEVYIAPSGGIANNFIFSPNNGMSIGGFTIGGTTGSPPAYGLSVSGSIGIGTRVPTARLHISGSTSEALLVVSSSAGPALFVSGSGNVGIGTSTPGYALEIANTGLYYAGASSAAQLLITTSGSVNKEGSFIAAGAGGNRTLQLGISDNSTVPVGIDMFETNDTFGSTYLNFRVNNANLVRMTGSFVGIGTITPSASLHVSGSTLIGNITTPALNDTTKVTANSGITTIYSILTASYDGAFFDYIIRSGSNARAGQIMGLWSGSSVNFTETTTTDFGSTSNFTFGMSISSSNMILSSSATSNGWTVKAIVRSI